MALRRRAVACVIADLTSAALASGNSDHNRATAPVTKGVATLVPPIVTASAIVPRLVIASSGCPQPEPSN
jgi:hypothetical protein